MQLSSMQLRTPFSRGMQRNRFLAARQPWTTSPAPLSTVVACTTAAQPKSGERIKSESEANAASGAVTEGKKSDEYSETMQKKMGTTLTYRHEDGMNYNRILPDLIVGSCLQTAEDVDHLFANEQVRTIFCLQEDSDMAYFNLDIQPIQQRCQELGVEHVRFRIRDFDPFDLRRKLPKAVSRLARSHDPSQGTVYIHCTAGLGRAPATALAYMAWLRDYQLDQGFELLRSQRMCSPRIEAIRSATVDMLMGTTPVEATIEVHRIGTATDFKIAGLDVGWHQQLDMSVEKGTGRRVLKRMLQPGAYQYKFVVEGVWSYSADHPTVQDGNNINNIIHVVGRDMDLETSIRLQRLLLPGADLMPDERQELHALLCPWRTHEQAHDQQQEGFMPVDFDPTPESPFTSSSHDLEEDDRESWGGLRA